MTKAFDLFREFAERYRAGEDPDEAAYLERANEDAPRLREMIAELRGDVEEPVEKAEPGGPAAERELEHLREELARQEDEGDDSDRVLALVRVAASLERLARFTEATELYEQAYAIFGRLGDLRGQLLSGLSQAGVLVAVARNEEAARVLERAIALAEQGGYRAETGLALGRLGDVDRELGRHDEALACLERAHSIWLEIGDRAAATEARQAIDAIEAEGSASVGDARGEADWFADWGRLTFETATKCVASLARGARDPYELGLTLARSSAQATFDSLPERAQFVFERRDDHLRCICTVATSGRAELAFDHLPSSLVGASVLLVFPAAKRRTPKIEWASGPSPGIVRTEGAVSPNRALTVFVGKVEYGFDELVELLRGACLLDGAGRGSALTSILLDFSPDRG